MRGFITAVVALSALTTGLCAVLYESDFGALPNGPAKVGGLSLSGGQYEIADGWLEVKSDKSNPSVTLKATQDGDGTFRATVRNAESCHWSGIVAKGVYRLEINRQFVHCALVRQLGDESKVVAKVGSPVTYAHNTQAFELRLAFVGSTVHAFLDDKKLFEYDDPEPVPPGGAYGLASGWGTDLAWQKISLSDEPDFSQWRFEELPRPAPEGLAQVSRVRGFNADNIYFDGEEAGLTFGVKGIRPGQNKVSLRCRLIDVHQRDLATRTYNVTLDAGEEQELKVSFLPPARGCFKIALDAGTSADDLGWLEDLGGFIVVSRSVYDAPRNPDSYFGGHMDGINLKWHLEAGRKIGIQWARCHNMMQWTWWRRIQPNGPDEWIWGDEPQQTVNDTGFFTLGQFLHVPDWASSAGEGAPGRSASPPRDWDEFARYVYKTVERYRTSIKYWEIWNEPHYSGFWRGTPEQYAKLIEVAHREAKRADPECIILGGGGVHPRSMAWIKQMLAAGGGKYMDGFTIHYLEPDIAREFMPELRRLLTTYGVTGPIWNSEESVPSTSFFDQIRRDHMEPDARYHFRNACYELVRTYMENISNGIGRVFYYDQADPWRFRQFDKPRAEEVSVTSNAMWDEGRSYRPVAAAHAALALAIEGKTYSSRIERSKLQAFVFEGMQTSTAVQYAMFDGYETKSQARLTLPPEVTPGQFTVIDFMGNERDPEVVDGAIILSASREPVYLVCDSTNAADTLRRMYGGAEMGD